MKFDTHPSAIPMLWSIVYHKTMNAILMNNEYNTIVQNSLFGENRNFPDCFVYYKKHKEECYEMDFDAFCDFVKVNLKVTELPDHIGYYREDYYK